MLYTSTSKRFRRRFQWSETLIRTRYGVRNGRFDSCTSGALQLRCLSNRRSMIEVYVSKDVKIFRWYVPAAYPPHGTINTSANRQRAVNGVSPSGKEQDFDSCIRRFESGYPSCRVLVAEFSAKTSASSGTVAHKEL